LRNSWAIPSELQQRLESMKISSVNDSMEELLYRCSLHWNNSELRAIPIQHTTEVVEPIERGVIGTIFLGPTERDYFFINPPGKDGYIGFKQELNHPIQDRSEVRFDVVPSFNKKRNEWSMKAVNVELIYK